VAEISAQAVKTLRDRTGAGMMDCKKALGEAEGDLEKAIEVLRERGLAKAVKRAGRATSEGAIAMALQGASGALVELGCETDFVAKTDDFQALADRIARTVLAASGEPSAETALELPIDGRPLSEHVTEAVGTMGENIVLKRVARLEVDGGGRVGGYVHAGGKLGVLVGLRTDAGGDAVEALAKDVAMHVAAADPTPVAVDRDGVPEDLVAKEAEIFRKQAEQEGKPANVVDKIVEGRVRKYYNEVCLLEQPFVTDPDKSVRQHLEEAGKQLGSPVAVSAFVRFRLGETSSE
jgi:elongation factor Ts